MSKGITEILAGGSESFRRANAHLVAGAVLPIAQPEIVAQRGKDGAKKRLRQSSEKRNKTEQAFWEWLSGCWPMNAMWQPLTLRLANGVRYTPDAFLFTATQTMVYEVKGFMRDDAAVKLKVAASMFPTWDFRLVSKKKGGGWDFEEVGR